MTIKNNKKNKAPDPLAEELFGRPADSELESSAITIDETVADAALMEELGIQVDPDLADEICAEVVSAADLEMIQP
jgi:hypothetical protein